MENNWERRKDYLELDNISIAELLKPVFPNSKILEADLLSGGLLSTNYKIKLDNFNQPFVIRIFMRDFSACQKEYNIFKLVKDKIKVPEIYFSDFTGDSINYPYSITEFIEGISLKEYLKNGDDNNLSDLACEIGQTLANLHTFKFSKHGFFSENLTVIPEGNSVKNWYITYLNDCLENEKVKIRLGKKLLEQLTNFINNNSIFLDNYTDYSLVHADFKPTNIFISNKKVSAILDWEFAFSGLGISDIGQFLRYSDYFPPDFERSFIIGYKEISGKLPGYWKKSAKFIDLANLLGFLVTEDEKPNVFKDVINLIQKTINDWNVD